MVYKVAQTQFAIYKIATYICITSYVIDYDNRVFEQTGKMALGSRLRLFTSRITDDAAKIYEWYKIDFAPKWFPVLFVLREGTGKTITEIANEIGHSQPSVSKITGEMIAAGLIKDNQKSTDKRRNMVALTKKDGDLSACCATMQGC